MNCHPCVRNGPPKSGRGDWIRTSDPLRPRPRPAIIRNFLQDRTSKWLIHRWIWRCDPLSCRVSDRADGGPAPSRRGVPSGRGTERPGTAGAPRRARTPSRDLLMWVNATQGFAGGLSSSSARAAFSSSMTLRCYRLKTFSRNRPHRRETFQPTPRWTLEL
jgi:hypothetical protein